MSKKICTDYNLFHSNCTYNYYHLNNIVNCGDGYGTATHMNNSPGSLIPQNHNHTQYTLAW